jgi:hypothetical protein
MAKKKTQKKQNKQKKKTKTKTNNDLQVYLSEDHGRDSQILSIYPYVLLLCFCFHPMPVTNLPQFVEEQFNNRNQIERMIQRRDIFD